MSEKFDRVEGRKHRDTPLGDPLNERGEHEHAAEIISKKWGQIPILRYSSTAWFNPAVAMAAFIGLVIILAVIGMLVS